MFELKKLTICFIVMGFCLEKGISLNCKVCTWPDDTSVGDKCYNSPDASTVPTLSCAFKPSDNPYCQTVFAFHDGILFQITRGCAAGAYDNDTSTNSMPGVEKCSASHEVDKYYDVETVNCYFACNGDDCNTNIVPYSLKLCSVDCGIYGSCDYITGNCSCEQGYSGETCATQDGPATSTFRKCIQCDEESHHIADCATYKTGAVCQTSSQQYCAVSKITTLDEAGNVIRETITRSCSDEYVATDECFISAITDDPYSRDVQYTCISTCDTDNCNTGIPDGFVSNSDPKEPLRCVVCNSDEDVSCATTFATTVCPSTATHCKSTVKYYISNKMDLSPSSEPSYELINIYRTCANTGVTSGCVNKNIDSLSLQEVTCQESCQVDGCNTGWPARPLCSQCSCNRCDSQDQCIYVPPSPTPCTLPYHAFCSLQDTNTGRSGYPRSFARSCRYQRATDVCVTTTYGGVKVVGCDKTCSGDGCNLGEFRGNGASPVLSNFYLIVFIYTFNLTVLLKTII